MTLIKSLKIVNWAKIRSLRMLKTKPEKLSLRQNYIRRKLKLQRLMV